MARKYKQILSGVVPIMVIEIIRIFKKHFYRSIRNGKNRKVIRSLLKKQEPIRVELGPGGRRMQGWITLGLEKECAIYGDLLEGMPFPDNCVTAIYCSHVLEHFYYPQLISLLSECYRILKPEGTFKAAVPNARIFLEAYFHPEKFDVGKYCTFEPALQYHSSIDYVNYIAYMKGWHRFLFDEENVRIILSKVGFKDVRLRKFDPALDLENKKWESVFVEARK